MSAVEVITLVIAIVGVVLAAASLSWQAATFVLSGHRVRVSLRYGAIRREPLGRAIRTTAPLTVDAAHARMMAEQGFTEPVLVALVRNVGRMAVSIERVEAGFDDGWSFSRLEDPENAPLPYRLEPGASEAWHVEAEPLQMVVDADGQPRRARMTVALGTGSVLRTKESVLVTPRQAKPGGETTTS